MTVYAKSKPPQTIPEHTRELITSYEELIATGYLKQESLEKYDTLMRKIISYHDLGKLNHKFQNKLKLGLPITIKELQSYDEVPHEWLSIAFITDEDKRFFKQFNSSEVLFSALVPYCIAFHHSRNKTFSQQAVQAFVEHDLEKRKGLLGIHYPLKWDYDIETHFEHKIWAQAYFKYYFPYLVYLKGMLHKCDYSASAGIDPEQKYKGDYQQSFKNWLDLKHFKLKDFQEKAKEYSDKSVVLVASTGMGKTECSMNWINGSKAFYLLGIRIAVNEMFKRFCTIFGDENVGLLHGETSYFLAETESDAEDYDIALAKIRQFSCPLTVATADQIVTSVFKFNGFELAYFTASYSKIVVDEIQSFAPEAIAAIVVFLKEIHSLGGRFMLMTATLPPFVRKEFEDLPGVKIPAPQYLDKKRHKIRLVDYAIESDYSVSLIKDKAKDKKILVICNTVAKVQHMYDALCDMEPQLIHARFIGKDRKQKESDIMNAAGPCVWISTQIVEASLDIDFDILFTECATIESLFQRFGRCFRKRDYTGDDANIFIFQSEPSRIYDSSLFKRTWVTLRDYDMRVLTEELKQTIIEGVFVGIDSIYRERYARTKDLLELGFRTKSKAEAQKEFRSFTNSHIVIPQPVYDANKQVITGLLNFIENKANDRIERLKKQAELRDYTVSLQVFSNKEKLLKLINGSEYCKKNSIMLLQGVEYTFKKGVEFIKDYKNYDNFIF